MGIFFNIFSFRRYEYEDILEHSIQTILVDDETSIICRGYKRNGFNKTVQFLICVLFAGIPYLCLRWYPYLEALFFWKRCSLEFAKVVLVEDKSGDSSLCPIMEVEYPETASNTGERCFRYFIYKLQRFEWCWNTMQFRPLKGLGNGLNTFSEIYLYSNGQTLEDKQKRLNTYGRNKISVDIKPYPQLLVDEILNPFYIFEAMSVILWTFDEYTYYAVFIVIVSAISIVMSLKQTRKQFIMLKSMASSVSEIKVTVHRPDHGKCEESSVELVPGDVIEIPSNGCVMMCDALLLSGTCIVSESTLTGESLPVTKVPPVHTNEIYNPNSFHMKHTLFCGTKIIQTRFYENNKVLAVVTNTGSNTAKGQLIRSILFSKPVAFDFMSESKKFILFLFFVAIISMCYSIYIYILRQASLETLLLRTLDIITIVVPPTLPAAMTVGTIYSKKRLKKKGIFCISPTRIIVSGKTSLVCFDKTGTLTEEGMDVWGVIPIGESDKGTLLSPPHLLPSDEIIIGDISGIKDRSLLKSALASCHSLTVIDDQICGDPLDLTMFKATKWELEEPGEDTAKFDLLDPTIVRPQSLKTSSDEVDVTGMPDVYMESYLMEDIPYEIGLIRQFPFMSSAQNMTVICRVLGERNMLVFSKGAPEKILSLCDKSTVPENINSTLSRYTSEGYRVIALAYKKMPRSFTWAQSQRITRDQIEINLNLIGILLMQNNIKEESAPVIHQLKKANIRSIMATGDNIRTAVSVGLNCGLLSTERGIASISVDLTTSNPQIITQPVSSNSVNEVGLNSQLVMDGVTWSHIKTYFPELFDAITLKTVIFARMSPQMKTHLIETLQKLDHFVIMCGDGANDCGALKAAHVGISLSITEEASIVAPFTCRDGNISCVLELIKEGRCALVTSFGLFNFMAMYSLVQFFSVIILYNIGVEMGTNEFLYVDLVVTTSLVMCMGSSGPSDSIIIYQPASSLLSARNVLPLIFQIAIALTFQLTALYSIKQQDWYFPVKPAEEDQEVVICWENMVIYITSCYQYLIFAFLYSRGKPYREPLHKNYTMLFLLISLFSFTSLLNLYPPDIISEFFEHEPWTESNLYFRIFLLLISVGNFTISYLIELLFIERIKSGDLLWEWFRNNPKKRSRTIEGVSSDEDWPPCVLLRPIDV